MADGCGGAAGNAQAASPACALDLAHPKTPRFGASEVAPRGTEAVWFPEIAADRHYVDAMALDLVRKPWESDVLVMENMFGDILSDLGAGLVGGMGMAPCAEIGERHGLFQPAHGSAPDMPGPIRPIPPPCCSPPR